MQKRSPVLSKSLRPPPVVKMKDGKAYDAFTDPEQRYRQRYVDLVVNKGIKDIFIKRTKMFNSMREYFNSHGYIEVETPILPGNPRRRVGPARSSPTTMRSTFPCICASPTNSISNASL